MSIARQVLLEGGEQAILQVLTHGGVAMRSNGRVVDRRQYRQVGPPVELLQGFKGVGQHNSVLIGGLVFGCVASRREAKRANFAERLLPDYNCHGSRRARSMKRLASASPGNSCRAASHLS